MDNIFVEGFSVNPNVMDWLINRVWTFNKQTVRLTLNNYNTCALAILKLNNYMQ